MEVATSHCSSVLLPPQTFSRNKLPISPTPSFVFRTSNNLAFSAAHTKFSSRTARRPIWDHGSLVTRALIENPNLIRLSLLLKAFSGLAALICGNGHIVGINQIYDVGIDKVNKPFLPIAAGDLSVRYAWFLVLSLAFVGVLIVGLNFGPFITSLYCLGLFLGTIYSVPPFRMKRFAVRAFLIIDTLTCCFHHHICNVICFGYCHN